MSEPTSTMGKDDLLLVSLGDTILICDGNIGSPCVPFSQRLCQLGLYGPILWHSFEPWGQS